MTHIKITQGLDIPMDGQPEAALRPLSSNGIRMHIQKIALDLSPFDDLSFKLLAHEGDVVKIGQPLAEDKAVPERLFVSPAGGVIREVRRGLKRRLLSIVIEIKEPEEYHEHGALHPANATREEIVQKLASGGIFARLRRRPFDLLADPKQMPRAIFVKAIESAPFAVAAEMQVEGHEKEFAIGLQALAKIAPLKLVYRKDSSCRAFTEADHVEKHTAEGPHPIGTHSVHIHALTPIEKASEVVWTATVQDVIAIGHLLLTGHTLTDRLISIAGSGIIPDRRGFFRVREGIAIKNLIENRLPHGEFRLISGDVLTGEKVTSEEFLGFYHYAFCVIPESIDRELLHFLRLGRDKFTASGAYISGGNYSFTTSQHGEERAFITSSPYDAVMPMRIPTMLLVKAIMAENFERAEELGLLEVASEDFALATFVCPSKIEMVEIVKKGLRQHARDILS